ncbi:MAG: hypothetical protein LBO69_00980 [Ignavibacteria bacterium]|jgi:hypothetical protein|nr:hypothetical protein [Ignavibacteria bacterium]
MALSICIPFVLGVVYYCVGSRYFKQFLEHPFEVLVKKIAVFFVVRIVSLTAGAMLLYKLLNLEAVPYFVTLFGMVFVVKLLEIFMLNKVWRSSNP